MNKIALALAVAAFPLVFIGAVSYDVATSGVYASDKVAEAAPHQSASGSIVAESRASRVIAAVTKDAKMAAEEVREFDSGVKGIFLKKFPLSKEKHEFVQVSG